MNAKVLFALLLLLVVGACGKPPDSSSAQVSASSVSFPPGAKALHGLIYKPDGPGPFPALGAESWDNAPALRAMMIRAVQRAKVPILFFQAANDYNLAPSRALYAAMRTVGASAEIRLYPAFGDSPEDGHSFPCRGVDVWKSRPCEVLG